MKPISPTSSTMWDWLMEAIFPSHCVGCGILGTFLCDTCIKAIPPAEPHAENYIRAVWSYRHNAVRHLIWYLKYDGVYAIAPLCARAIGDSAIEDLAERSLTKNSTPVMVIATPIGPKRLKERGYNQAELIAASLVKYVMPGMLVHLPGALTKTHDTTPQMSFPDKRTRLTNLKGLFVVTCPEAIRDNDIILIDDVVTTGATLGEARRVLLEAGARSVHAYVVAH
ncbi:MAG: ComF family protein [Candidatus Yonathbacteria bacterium]|nr:ComF family protein [Candidatus Yonathbacteria bacterium]